MDALDGTAVRAWARAAHEALTATHERIDAINVFPVADADTGTNVLLTVAGGRQALDDVPPDAGAGQVAQAFAHGALLSARGNSGIILSQYLAGLAHELPPLALAHDLAAAFAGAARRAREAVADPQEGTVLTVARDVADGALAAVDAGADLGAVLDGVLGHAHRSLAPTSARHPVLRAAHVLDAGACALLVVLDALARVVHGAGAATAEDLAWLPSAGAGQASPDGGGAYEVMLLVRAGSQEGEDRTAQPGVDSCADPGALLRDRVQALGDSVAVVGADGWWHVHVHTDDPAAVVEACAVGAREQVVVRLVGAAHAGTAGVPAVGLHETDTRAPGVVVCTASPRLVAWYAALGAVVVLRCPEVPLSGRHVARAVVDAGATTVTVLTGEVLEPAVADEVGSARLGPAGENGTARPCRPSVVDSRDELGTAVALLALSASTQPGPAAAYAALERLRSVPVKVDGLAVDRWADAVLDALDDTVRAWPTGPAPEHVTVVHGDTLGSSDVARLASRLEDAAAARHPALEVLVLGPAAHVDGLRLGVD
ncbi:DAK2 domain-containing protein [Cellulomonas soli]